VQILFVLYCIVRRGGAGRQIQVFLYKTYISTGRRGSNIGCHKSGVYTDCQSGKTAAIARRVNFAQITCSTLYDMHVHRFYQVLVSTASQYRKCKLVTTYVKRSKVKTKRVEAPS